MSLKLPIRISDPNVAENSLRSLLPESPENIKCVFPHFALKFIVSFPCFSIPHKLSPCFYKKRITAQHEFEALRIQLRKNVGIFFFGKSFKFCEIPSL